jgi:hypothetical protein
VFALPLIPPVRSKAFEPRAWGSGHPSDRTVRPASFIEYANQPRLGAQPGEHRGGRARALDQGNHVPRPHRVIHLVRECSTILEDEMLLSETAACRRRTSYSPTPIQDFSHECA